MCHQCPIQSTSSTNLNKQTRNMVVIKTHTQTKQLGLKCRTGAFANTSAIDLQLLSIGVKQYKHCLRPPVSIPNLFTVACSFSWKMFFLRHCSAPCSSLSPARLPASASASASASAPASLLSLCCPLSQLPVSSLFYPRGLLLLLAAFVSPSTAPEL